MTTLDHLLDPATVGAAVLIAVIIFAAYVDVSSVRRRRHVRKRLRGMRIVPTPRAVDALPRWRALLLTIGLRCVEIAERGRILSGDALLQRIRNRWERA